MMSIILADLPRVEHYIDDVIIHGMDMSAHDKTLQAVLHWLESAGLQPNHDKCQFRQSSLPSLGHTVSANGLLPDDTHIQAITNAPTPMDAAILCSFLGLLSWYSKFLPKHATIVEPMHSCLRHTDSAFKWTIAAQERSLSAADLDFASAECSELSKLRAQIAQGWPLSPKGLDSDLLPYYRLQLELAVKDNFVFHGSRLIVPTALRSSIFSIANKSHQGVVHTKQQVRELYWWPKMDALVNAAISSCQTCQLNDKTAKPHPASVCATSRWPMAKSGYGHHRSI
ncbi:hypothetical protein MHYP_G00083990 [Metynnis hypsauchen]